MAGLSLEEVGLAEPPPSRADGGRMREDVLSPVLDKGVGVVLLGCSLPKPCT